MIIRDAYYLSHSIPQPIKWAVENFLPYNVLGDISSPPDCGKTSFLLPLLAAMANGEPTWFGRKIINGHVVVIGGEKSSEDVWTRDFHRCGKVEYPKSFTILEPGDFLWKWQTQQWVRTKKYMQVSEYLKSLSPVMTVIDTIARAAQGYDPMQITQQTLLAKAAEDLQRDIGGNLLTVSHTNQLSQSLELHQRLDYTSRSGGNGYPGWLRWLGAMTTLTDAEKVRLNIDLHMRVVAVAVSKPSEMPVPEVGNKFSPWLFEFDSDGRFREIINSKTMMGRQCDAKTQGSRKESRAAGEGGNNGKAFKGQIFFNPK